MIGVSPKTSIDLKTHERLKKICLHRTNIKQMDIPIALMIIKHETWNEFGINILKNTLARVLKYTHNPGFRMRGGKGLVRTEMSVSWD